MHANRTGLLPYAHRARLAAQAPGGRIATLSRRPLLVAGALAVLAVLAGCASAPKPVVTAVTLDITAAADLNPDARGRASPLTVRVYALKTPGVFQSADFFSLYDKDSATLGAELVKREEFQLAPGEKKTLQMTLEPDARSLGVMAAYRDLERARWRDLQPLQVGQGNNFKLNLGARQASLSR